MARSNTSQIFTETIQDYGMYETQNIQIIEGLLFSQYKIIKMCEYYSNSKYLFGNKDELNRDKPFYNIVNFRVTIAKTATDLDIKDIQIGSDDPNHYVHSMLLQKEGYEWMKATDYGLALNERGQTRAKYGGVLVKKVMEEGELKIDTVDWRNVATDQVDTLGGAIIETHYMTPQELMDKQGIWNAGGDDILKEAIIASKKTYAKGAKYSLKNEQHNTDRIVVREVTGRYPASYLYEFNNDQEYIADDTDEYRYTLQHYFFADINNKEFRFFGEEMKDEDFQYKYLPWERMPGRALGRGVIEDSEEAQVWTNDAVVSEKLATDIGGKVLVSTTSKTVGGNILELDNGHIFELENGTEIHAENLEPAAIGEFQNQIDRWKAQADDATSSYDANSGKQPPADTPYSQTALLNQVAAKPFDYRREEAGIFETEIWNEWIIPHLIKKLYSGHILATDFTDEELQMIDGSFSRFRVNEKVWEQIGANKIVSYEQYQSAVQLDMASMKGSKRFLQIPDGYFDDIQAKVTVLTTGEQKNKAAILQSLSTILGEVMQTYNAQTNTFAVLENPVMARIFGTILELSGAGISPSSLGIGGNQAQTPAQGQAPTGQPQAAQTQPASPSGSAMPLAAPSPIQGISAPQTA